MTAAAHFSSRGFFPFCLDTLTPGNGVVGNLTLAEVMDFYWKLETYTFTFAGTVTRGPDSFNFGQTATNFPPAASVCNEGKFLLGSLYPDSTTFAAFASLPQSARKPFERVCVSTAFAPQFGGEIIFRKSGESQISFVGGPNIDGVNSGKYAIAYQIRGDFRQATAPNITANFYEPGAGSGGTLSDTGTVTIGGIAFPWELYVATGDTTSGVSLTATSSNFTF